MTESIYICAFDFLNTEIIFSEGFLSNFSPIRLMYSLFNSFKKVLKNGLCVFLGPLEIEGI